MDFVATITPSKRRRQRRLRSLARLRWHLFRKGRIHLTAPELRQIKDTLSRHHSVDWSFHRKITAAMEQWKFKQTPWKCRHCRRLSKAAATYCGQCGRHWAEAQDGSYRHVQPQDRQQRDQADPTYAYWQEETPWSQRSWQDGRGPSQSPRSSHRSQTPQGTKKPRTRGKGQNKHHKGKGKKGQDGKQFQAPPLPETPWKSTSSQSAQPTSAAPPSQAEQQLRTIVAAMKKNEASLPADLQTLLHENHKVQSQDLTKQLHSAVTKLGKAKKALAEARASRLNLHTVWRNYLDASVEKWKQFCQDFAQQDTELAQQVTNASDAVRQAQEGLEASKKEVKDTEESDPEGKSEMAVEISDEEGQENMDSKGQVLKEGMSLLLQSLENLRTQAETAVEENACKRPRLHHSDGNGGDSSTPTPLEHFGKPGQ